MKFLLGLSIGLLWGSVATVLWVQILNPHTHDTTENFDFPKTLDAPSGLMTATDAEVNALVSTLIMDGKQGNWIGNWDDTMELVRKMISLGYPVKGITHDSSQRGICIAALSSFETK